MAKKKRKGVYPCLWSCTVISITEYSIVLLPPTAFHIWISAAELHTSVSLGVLWISKRLSNKHLFYNTEI